MTRRRAAAEVKDRRVRAIIGELLAAADDLDRDIARLRAALREVDRRDRKS